LGLWLATIGLDPLTGTQRYTFGQLFLWDGVGLVPVTIGFYAIPELVDLAVQRSSIAETTVGRVGGVWQGVRDTFRHWFLVLRCSAVGTFVSIIPGLGAATTQWLAYAHAVQSSPDRARFGKGAVEGVLGPGAANNSTLGGSLVTTIAFGVPASVSTAILMGAFFIQGLVPGPTMLAPAPRGHLAVTLAMVWTIVISNVITVAVCLLFMGQLARITRIRGALLVPCILTVVYVGAFAEKNVFQDLGVVMACGSRGVVMARLGGPRPPLLLGLVLGPLAENRLFLSTDNYGAAWLLRPGVLLLVGVAAVGLAVSLVRRRRRDPSGDRPRQAALRAWLHLDGATAVSLRVVLLAVWALWQSRSFGPRAGLFPWVVTVPLLALALVQLGRDLSGHRDDLDLAEADGEVPPAVARRRTLEVSVWILGMFVAIWLVGFAAATLLTTFLYLKLGSREGWAISLGMSLGGFAFVYGL